MKENVNMNMCKIRTPNIRNKLENKFCRCVLLLLSNEILSGKKKLNSKLCLQCELQSIFPKSLNKLNLL